MINTMEKPRRIRDLSLATTLAAVFALAVVIDADSFCIGEAAVGVRSSVASAYGREYLHACIGNGHAKTLKVATALANVKLAKLVFVAGEARDPTANTACIAHGVAA